VSYYYFMRFPQCKVNLKLLLTNSCFPPLVRLYSNRRIRHWLTLPTLDIQQPLIPEASLWAKLQNVCSFNLYTFFSPLVVIFRFRGVQLGLTDFRILKSQQTSTPLNSSNPKLGRLALSTLSLRKNLPIIKN